MREDEVDEFFVQLRGPIWQIMSDIHTYPFQLDVKTWVGTALTSVSPGRITSLCPLVNNTNFL